MKLNNIKFDPKFFTRHLNRKSAGALLAILFVLGALVLFGAMTTPVVQAQATATPTNTPTTAPTNTPIPTALATGVPVVQGNGLVQYLVCGSYSFGSITPGSCVQIYNGSSIDAYSATGARTYRMDGATGNITTSGVISQGASGTKCVSGSQSITGSGTVVPGTLSGAGISTPSAVAVSLGSDSTGDLHHLSTTKAAGVVTLKVWNSALTPVASSGAATVDFIVCGQ